MLLPSLFVVAMVNALLFLKPKRLWRQHHTSIITLRGKEIQDVLRRSV